jgi:phosphoglycolate phosphatase
MNYDAVIFDFDGTLADTGPDVWASLDYAAGRAGGRMRADFASEPPNLGLPMETIFRAVEPFPGDEAFRQFEEDVRRHYRFLNDYTRTALYPGVRELLEEMQSRGLPAYIVSLKPCEALTRIIAAKGWERWFPGRFSPDSFGGENLPKVALLRRLVSDRLRGAKVVYVGDTWTDVAAARACGIDSIGAAYGDGDVSLLLAECPTMLAYDSRDLGPMILGGGEG